MNLYAHALYGHVTIRFRPIGHSSEVAIKNEYRESWILWNEETRVVSLLG